MFYSENFIQLHHFMIPLYQIAAGLEKFFWRSQGRSTNTRQEVSRSRHIHLNSNVDVAEILTWTQKRLGCYIPGNGWRLEAPAPCRRRLVLRTSSRLGGPASWDQQDSTPHICWQYTRTLFRPAWKRWRVKIVTQGTADPSVKFYFLPRLFQSSTLLSDANCIS